MQRTAWAIVAGIAVIASCGGAQQMGMEDEIAGSGGSTPAGGSGAAGASAKGGAAGEGTSAGGDATGAGGEGVIAPLSRCGFTPEEGPSSGPFASGTSVLSKISLFIGDFVVKPADVPAQATPAWAGETANALLDEASSAGTVPAGLARFLETWFSVQRPADSSEPFFADVWAPKLAAPDATLSTLLAEPSSDPVRVGILTDPQVLARRGTITQRGVWIYQNLFCGEIPPVPPGLPVPSEQLEDETRREWLAREVADPLCVTCHELSDPPGWAFENFDEAGAYRETDNGQPVDSSGTLVTPGGEQLSFESIVELAPELAASCEVAHCFTRALMNHAYAVDDPSAGVPYGEAELNHVANRFADSDFALRELVSAIVQTPSFLQ